MALIPETLPSGSCYGTPQQLLELFAQYLTIPAFSISTKVLYGATSPSPDTGYVWVNTSGGDTPLLNLYNDATGGYEPFPFAGGVSSNERLISDKTAITTMASADLLLVSTLGGGSYSSLKKITVANAGMRVVQVVQGSTTTQVTVSTSALTDSGLSVSITPTSASNKVLVMVSQAVRMNRDSVAAYAQGAYLALLRNSTQIYTPATGGYDLLFQTSLAGAFYIAAPWAFHILDSPASTSAVTYKMQGYPQTTATVGSLMFQYANAQSTIIAMEIRA